MLLLARKLAPVFVIVFCALGSQPALAARGPAIVRPPQAFPVIDAPAVPSGPMTYHGGPVQLSTKTYAIFWKPAKLQSGAAAKYASGYTKLVTRFLKDESGSAWYNIGTQYYQDINSQTSFITNTSKFGGSYTDTTPYPTGECSTGYTGTNCLLDSDIRAAVGRAITAKGWKVKPTSEFFVFTAKDEGSCFNASQNDCSFTEYCGYHTYNSITGKQVYYANMPYLVNTNYTCAVAGQPSPNNKPAADYEINVLSHEAMETRTDPEIDAWYASNSSGEIGDLCAWTFGSAGLDGGLANEELNGHFYYIQQEYSNASTSCVQTYP